jgi:hypothetical protein
MVENGGGRFVGGIVVAGADLVYFELCDLVDFSLN